MSHVIKCSRVIPRYSRCLAPTIAPSRQLNTDPIFKEEYHSENHLPKYLVGGLSAFFTLYLGHNVAYAKDDDDEDDEDEVDDEDQADMEANMDSHISEELDDMSQFEQGETRLEKWMKEQERYLLLDAERRGTVEIRDSVTEDELAEVDRLYDEQRLTDLEDKLVELNTSIPNNDEILWRLARMKWASIKGYDSVHQHKTYHVALNLAIKAANINPENGDAHRWIAVLGAYVAEKDGIIASVLDLQGFKYHVDKALEINPDDHIAWTLLGNWHFEIADLTKLNKLWCNWVVGEVPSGGSYEEALKCFKKSEELSQKPWSINTLNMAKCYLRTGHTDEALDILKVLARRTIVSVEDYRVRKEAHLLIEKLTNPTLKEKIISIITGRDGTKYRVPRTTKEVNTFVQM